MGERTKVAGTLAATQAGEAEAGKGFGEIDADEEEAFIVDEVGVVFRFPLLDEAPLEEECFGVGFDLNDIEIGDQFDEGADFRGVVVIAGRSEVGADPFAQGLGFPHVNDAPQAVLHEVDARFFRELADLFLEVRGDDHGWAFRAEVEGWGLAQFVVK